MVATRNRMKDQVFICFSVLSFTSMGIRMTIDGASDEASDEHKVNIWKNFTIHIIFLHIICLFYYFFLYFGTYKILCICYLLLTQNNTNEINMQANVYIFEYNAIVISTLFIWNIRFVLSHQGRSRIE